jgi:hypothetical protein
MSKHEPPSGESIKEVARWYLEHWSLTGIQELPDVTAFEERFLDVRQPIDMSQWPDMDVMVALNFGVLDRRHDDETGSAIAELNRRANAAHMTVDPRAPQRFFAQFMVDIMVWVCGRPRYDILATLVCVAFNVDDVNTNTMREWCRQTGT